MAEKRAHTVLLEVTFEVADGESVDGRMGRVLAAAAELAELGALRLCESPVGGIEAQRISVRWNATGARLDDAVAAVPAEPGPIVYAVDDTASIAARLRELEAERAGARSGAEVGEFAPAKPTLPPLPPLDPLLTMQRQMLLDDLQEAKKALLAQPALPLLVETDGREHYLMKPDPLRWPSSPEVRIEADNERQAQRARLLRSLAEKPVQSVVFQHDAGRPPMRGGQSLGHFMGRATFTGLASDGGE